MNRARLKFEAKKSLQGNWGWAAVVALVMTIINALIFGPRVKEIIGGFKNIGKVHVNSSFVASIADPGFWGGRLSGNAGMSFLSGFFMLSMAVTFLNFARGRKLPFFKAIFSTFTDGRFIPEFLNYLFSYLFVCLWSLLLVIPGWIKAYSYALTPYIVNDMVESGQSVHATTAITASRRLMAGHKWELFVLDLSFLGWFILSMLTLGIGFIWLIPYEQTTKATFYRELAGDQFKH